MRRKLFVFAKEYYRKNCEKYLLSAGIETAVGTVPHCSPL
jgi:hypothetical protein